MTTADKLERLTQHLIGDIGRLPGVVFDSAGEAQLGQLLLDAFERVGQLAMDEWEAANNPKPCTADDCGYAEPHVHSAHGITVM